MNRRTPSHGLRAALAAAAAALAPGALAAPGAALIWGGGRTPAAASQALRRWEALGKRAGLAVPAGFPKIVESATVPGLKPGFHVVVLGFCAPAPGVAALARVKEVEPGAYLRDVEGPALACPELLARGAGAEQAPGAKPGAPAPDAEPSDGKPVGAKPAQPPQKLFALVLGRGDNRAELEGEGTRWLQEPHPVKLAPGYPAVEARKRLPLVADADASSWLLAGVCPEDRAAVMGELTRARERLELRRGTPACPTVLPEGVPAAVELAVKQGATGLALELLAQPIPQAQRPRLALAAAGSCAPEVLERVMAGGALDEIAATAALGAAVTCEGPYAYHRDEAREAALAEAVVQRLLAAGGSARGHADWVAAALRANRPGIARLLVKAGADPRAAPAQAAEAALRSPPEALAWVLSFEPDPKQLARALASAAGAGKLEHVRLLVRAGADPAAVRGEDGLTALDRLLLPGAAAEPALAQALVEARPAFAAALAGDAQALAALAPAALDERFGGWSPLAVAAARGRDAAGLLLLERGADPALVVPPGAGGHDVLSLAIAGGARRLAVALAGKGVPLDRATPACCFERRAGHDLVLLRTAARKVYRDEKLPPVVKLRPLHRAAMAGQVEVVQALLAGGADPNQADDSGLGLTPVMLAAEAGQVGVFEPLAAAKGRAAQGDAARYSAVAHAVLSPDPGATVVALQASFGARVVEGAPGALSAAVLHGPEGATLVERLLAAGAGKKGEGRRAVQDACRWANEPAFVALEAAGYSTGKAYWGGCVEEGD